MAGGIVDAVGPEIDAAGAREMDGAGLLALPGMIDGHVHLDKTLTGLPWMPYPAGPDRASRIATERGLRPTLPPPAERASNLVRRAVAAGTTAFRSHADIGPDIALRHVEALLEIKAAFAHAADFQVVAFPRHRVDQHVGILERGPQIRCSGQRLGQPNAGEEPRVLALAHDLIGYFRLKRPEHDPMSVVGQQRGERRAPAARSHHGNATHCPRSPGGAT